MAHSCGTVLVTGANGFAAARTVEAFLKAGYSVRGTVRRPASARQLLDSLSEYVTSGKLTTVIVPDITVDGAFTDAVKGVTAIAHLASPVDFTNTDVDQVIQTAVKSTSSILQSSLAEPSLKAFVFMSSIVTMWDANNTRPVTELDWADDAELMKTISTENAGLVAYIVSKIRAERAFWEFRERHHEHITFSMSTVHPLWIGGVPLLLPKDPAQLCQTASVVYQVLTGQEPSFSLGNGMHVDVHDVADLVVFGVRNTDVADRKRYIAGGNGNFANIQAHRDILRKAYPSRQSIIPEGEPGKGYLADFGFPDQTIVDSSATEMETGQKWIPFDKMVLDAAKAYEVYL